MWTKFKDEYPPVNSFIWVYYPGGSNQFTVNKKAWLQLELRREDQKYSILYAAYRIDFIPGLSKNLGWWKHVDWNNFNLILEYVD